MSYEVTSSPFRPGHLFRSTRGGCWHALIEEHADHECTSRAGCWTDLEPQAAGDLRFEPVVGVRPPFAWAGAA